MYFLLGGGEELRRRFAAKNCGEELRRRIAAKNRSEESRRRIAAKNCGEELRRRIAAKKFGEEKGGQIGEDCRRRVARRNLGRFRRRNGEEILGREFQKEKFFTQNPRPLETGQGAFPSSKINKALTPSLGKTTWS